MLQHLGSEELAGPRLLLRRYRPEDAEAMFEIYAADERVTRFLSWLPYDSVNSVRDFLIERIAEYDKPDIYHWAIDIGGLPTGSISAFNISEKNELCEVGYCLGYDYWNRGILTEALTVVLGFLFSKVGMRRVFAKHDVENPASGRVMQKCGMTYEGRLREHYRRHDGSCSDALFYGILRDDFTKAHS